MGRGRVHAPDSRRRDQRKRRRNDARVRSRSCRGTHCERHSPHSHCRGMLARGQLNGFSKFSGPNDGHREGLPVPEHILHSGTKMKKHGLSHETSVPCWSVLSAARATYCTPYPCWSAVPCQLRCTVLPTLYRAGSAVPHCVPCWIRRTEVGTVVAPGTFLPYDTAYGTASIMGLH